MEHILQQTEVRPRFSSTSKWFARPQSCPLSEHQDCNLNQKMYCWIEKLTPPSQLYCRWNPFSLFIGHWTMSQDCAENMVMIIILWHNAVTWGSWNISILTQAAQPHRLLCHATWKTTYVKVPPNTVEKAYPRHISLRVHPVKPPRLERLMERCHFQFHQLLKAVAVVSPNLCWNNGNAF